MRHWSFLVCMALLGASSTAYSDASIRRASPDRRVQDAAGRLQYIVTLDAAALDSMRDSVPPQEAARFLGQHPGRVRNLVLALEGAYGFQHFGMTSRVGLTLTAYLTPGQARALARDPRVTEISEVSQLEFSAQPTPPWQDLDVEVLPGVVERLSWGRAAARGIKLRNGAQPRIYVVDSGIGYHNDLNVVTRVNPNRLLEDQTTTVSPVGCYSHATHVAGIIGARGDNGGAAGMLADAPLISVAVTTANNTSISPPCGQGASDAGTLAALEWVAQNHPSGQSGVVNLSINGFGSFDPGGSLHNAMLALRNAGLVVVQSAGNQFTYASWYAFHEPCFCANAADGILVVGGVDQSGATVRGPTGYVNPWGTEPGSNFGAGVDVWAPSLAIYSTWGVDPATPTALQPSNPAASSSFYLNVSGTSMAAPFIAGMAAAILSKEPGLPPAQVEERIRNARYWLRETDNESQSVWLGVTPDAVVIDDMVERYYKDILNRSSDPGGKTFWISEVSRLAGLGVDPREAFRTIAKQLFFGAEYDAPNVSVPKFLTDLYRAFYQRQPDAGGFNYWSGQFPSQQHEGLHNNFMFAQEFESYMVRQLGISGQRHDTSFVVDVYRAALGRVPDSGGLLTHRSSIRNAKCSGGDVGAAARNIVSTFFASQEYAQRSRNNRQFMTDLYEAILRRGPDSDGLNWWVDRLNQGYPRTSAINDFFGLPEWNQVRIQQLMSDPC